MGHGSVELDAGGAGQARRQPAGGSVLRQHVGGEGGDVAAGGFGHERSHEGAAQAPVLPGVLHQDRDLRLRAASRRTVPSGHGHDLVAVEGHQALVVVMVDGRQVVEDAWRRSLEQGEEAPVHSVGGKPAEEAPQPLAVTGADGTDFQFRE